jgi:hypothetical protein
VEAWLGHLDCQNERVSYEEEIREPLDRADWLSLSRSPAVGPWGMPDAAAPPEELVLVGADAVLEVAAAGVDGVLAAGALCVWLEVVLEDELEPQPAAANAPTPSTIASVARVRIREIFIGLLLGGFGTGWREPVGWSTAARGPPGGDWCWLIVAGTGAKAGSLVCLPKTPAGAQTFRIQARLVAQRPPSPSRRAAFSLSTSGRTSSLIGSFSKSASQRSGVIRGKSDPNSIFFLSCVFV